MTCWRCCFGRTSNKKRDLSSTCSGLSSGKNIKLFSYAELRSATNNFSPSNKIGRGGFGTVYKGTLRNGGAVAVKVLAAYSRQGIKEFLTEIDVIANVKHPNLVELVGCCVQGDSRILVYEHLRNSSLDRALLGSSSDPAKFSWSMRRGICVGVARGLAFLHETSIVHRDIKASNVLLDAGYTPKIGDFGLAKLFPDDITHISTRVAGTTGYLAPEYAWHGQLTKKADVYSFGVLVLETVSGRSSSRSLLLSPQGCKALLETTWELYEEGRLREMVDPAMTTMLRVDEEEEAVRYMKVALLCTQAAPLRRPSMAQVVEMLSRGSVRVNEREITAPGYINIDDDCNKMTADNNNYTVTMLAPTTVTEISPR